MTDEWYELWAVVRQREAEQRTAVRLADEITRTIGQSQAPNWLTLAGLVGRYPAVLAAADKYVSHVARLAAVGNLDCRTAGRILANAWRSACADGDVAGVLAEVADRPAAKLHLREHLAGLRENVRGGLIEDLGREIWRRWPALAPTTAYAACKPASKQPITTGV